MKKNFSLCLALLLCMVCTTALPAAEIRAPQPAFPAAEIRAPQPGDRSYNPPKSGFEFVNDFQFQLTNEITNLSTETLAETQRKIAIAQRNENLHTALEMKYKTKPDAVSLIVGRETLSRAKQAAAKANIWGQVAKFGKLDYFAALQNGWDIGIALQNCWSAFQNGSYDEFSKEYNKLAKASLKAAALIALAGCGGVPGLIAGLLVGAAIDLIFSHAQVPPPAWLSLAKLAWDAFNGKEQIPMLLSATPGSSNTGAANSKGQTNSAPANVKLKKHQVH